jgi:hypothetical protein
MEIPLEAEKPELARLCHRLAAQRAILRTLLLEELHKRIE